MRKAFNDYDFIVEDGIFYGISLGYDFTAEHEWGIKGLKRIFGIPEPSKKNMGIKSRSITKIPKETHYSEFVFEKKTVAGVVGAILYIGNPAHTPRDLEKYHEKLKSKKEWNEKNPSIKTPTNIITAWSEEDFGVAVVGEKEVEYLTELHKEFLNKNIAITSLGSTNPFSNNSLSLLIADRLPQEVLDNMYGADKKYYDREDYEKKIGMTKLKEQKKGSYEELHYFMACSPKWINYEDKTKREEQKKILNTKYDIQYWINYSDDDDNCGWYTVEEIRTWLKGDKTLVEVEKEMRKKD